LLKAAGDEDVFGAGYAHGTFSNLASSTYTDDHERALKVYYNTSVTPWLSLSPNIQYIGNSGETKPSAMRWYWV
jgi:carbohydrate-selective porin OprB